MTQEYGRLNESFNSDSMPLSQEDQTFNKKAKLSESLDRIQLVRAPSFYEKYKKQLLVAGLVSVFIIILIIIVVQVSRENVEPEPKPELQPDAKLNLYSIKSETLVTLPQQISGVAQLSQADIAKEMERPHLQNGLIVDPREVPTGANNKVIENIYFQLGQVDVRTARVILTSDDDVRFSVPDSLVPRPNINESMRTEVSGLQLLNKPFGFKYVDTKTGQTLITTEGQTFVMEDKFIQLDLVLPTQRIFGLGERKSTFLLKEGTWTMWASGEKDYSDNGTADKQTFGVHPFVLVQSSIKSEFVGIWFRNSNAQSPVVKFIDDGKTRFSYITTGGQLEIYFMFKGGAKDIIRQYQNLIGKPSLPPMWSLGWQAGGKGYTDDSLFSENYNGYVSSGFPLEAVWVDFDYMKNGEPFTFDDFKWSQLSKQIDYLHSVGKKVLVTLGPGISRGNVSDEILIKSALSGGKPLTQSIWNNNNVFLDFMQDKAKEVWAQGIKNLYEKIKFDGIILDMNEVTGKCNGECSSSTKSVQEQALAVKEKVVKFLQAESGQKWWHSHKDQDKDSTYFLPFIPGSVNLDQNSLSLNATHPGSGYKEYDMHSLFGLSQAKATYEILTNQTTSPIKDKRILILSRSTFSGSGKYSQHWLGNNFETIKDMDAAVAGTMKFNMFGMPLVGPDVCGFTNEIGQEIICSRWVILSSFLPLARQNTDVSGLNGNNEIWRMTEPYKTLARDALFNRLQYVRQMYTCMFEASLNGGTCFDPLLYYYPEVSLTFSEAQIEIEDSFVFAGTYKISINLLTTTVFRYFPNGNWVSMDDFGNIIKVVDKSGGEIIEMNIMNSQRMNVHLMPGKIGVFQNNSDHTKFTTRDMNNNKSIALVVNRNQQKHASNTIFLDDGESLSKLEGKEYEHYELLHNGQSLLKQNLNTANKKSSGFFLEKLVITNAEDLKDVDEACFIFNNGEAHTFETNYDSQRKTLNISAPSYKDKSVYTFFEMKSIHYLRTGKDLNRCSLMMNYYSYPNTAVPDFSGSTSSISMSSQKATNLVDLDVNFKVLQQDLLQVRWDYKQGAPGIETKRPTYKVQQMDKQDASQHKLSDYVNITQEEGFAMISIFKDGIKRLEIEGFILDDFFNFIDLNAYTQFGGLMGTIEEIRDSLIIPDGTYGLWASSEDRKHSINPFFMAKVENGWYGVLINVAAAQDWQVKNFPKIGETKLKITAAAGMGEIFVIMGNTAEDVIRLYQNRVVGRPRLSPTWAFGWGQSRRGIKNTAELQAVVEGYKQHGLPLDMVFSDIDYMDNYRMFTYDKVNYKGLDVLVNDLTKNNLHWIPTMFMGLSQRPFDNTYDYYHDKLGQTKWEQNSLISYDNKIDQSNQKNSHVFTAKTWSGDTAYFNWFGGQVSKQDWVDFSKKLNFSGFLIDQSHAENWCDGICYSNQAIANPIRERLEYIPTGRSLEKGSLALDAHYSLDNVNPQTLEVDVHSLNSREMSRAFETSWDNKRILNLQKGAFSGQGFYSQRWTGAVESTAEAMGHSVTSLIQNNLMGFPLTGSDICGNTGNASVELCARWYTLGAFYTLSRNHKMLGYQHQEPYLFANMTFPGGVSVLDVVKKAMWTKFKLHKYMYSELTVISNNGGDKGGVFHRPLFFQFDKDSQSYEADHELNFMLGSSIKVSVNSKYLGQDKTNFYFPPGIWCNLLQPLNTNTCLSGANKGPFNLTLSTNVSESYAHLMEGRIVALQDGQGIVTVDKKTTTADLLDYPIELHINPNCNGTSCISEGFVWNDDGNNPTPQLHSNDYTFKFYSNNSSVLLLDIELTWYSSWKVQPNDQLSKIRIYNAQDVGFGGNYAVEASFQSNKTTVKLPDATYNSDWDALEWIEEENQKVILPQFSWIKFTKKTEN